MTPDPTGPPRTARASQVLPPAGRSKEESETRARVFGHYADTWSRLLMVVAISAVFLGLNYQVMDFVKSVFRADLDLLKQSAATPRVITTQVVMSLIGATVVQVGVAIIAIVSYLFPKNRDKVSD